MLPIWAFSLIVTPVVYLIFSCISYIRSQRDISRVLKGLDQAPGYHWLYGNLKCHPGFNNKLVEYFQELIDQFPKCHVFYFGSFRPCVIVTHPDTIREITKVASSKFTVGGGGYKLMAPWLGHGLLTGGVQDGRWFRNRRLLTPAFHFDVLKPYMAIYNESAKKLMKKFSGHESESFEITSAVSLCTLDVIMKCALSCDYDVQETGKNDPYVSAVYELGELVLKRAINIFLTNDVVYSLTSNGRKFYQLCDFVHQVALDIIKKRQQELSKNSTQSSKRYLDFLDILLSARDENGEGLTIEEIQQEVDTFMFAGHDTTASATTWILYSLAKHQEHQQTCRAEIEGLLEDRKEKEFLWDDMSSIPYLSRCIKESLRLHTPVPFISRQLDKPTELEGVNLKENTIVDINLYQLHHNPEVWGDDHNEYKPERFLPENINKMSPHAFLPFSAGPRNCIGQNFAMNELKVIIATALYTYDIEIDESHTVLYKPSLVMRTETGIKLRFIPRNKTLK